MSRSGNFRILLLFSLSAISVNFVNAQSFSELTSVQLKGQELGFSSWCDVNRDGFLDIFITGLNLTNGVSDYTHSIIYLNNGQGGFNESTITNIPRLIYGSHDWGDVNNDGWPDLLLSGTTSGYALDGGTKVYLNKEGADLELTSIELPGVTGGKVLWADFDNDGWQDVFLMGTSKNGEFTMKLFWNRGNLQMDDSQIPFSIRQGGILNLQRCSAIAQDFDSDGDMDLVVGQSSKAGYSVDFYENIEGNLVLKPSTLPQLNYVSFASADFNGDGFYDLVVNGIPEPETTSTFASPAHFVVLSGGVGHTFPLIKRFDGHGSYWGSVSAGDVNNDGLPDIFINGTGNGSARNTIFINNGGQNFTRTDQGFPGTLLGDASLGDLENDGDLDILFTGSLNGSAGTAQARIYRNTTTHINVRPTKPGDLKTQKHGGKIKLMWSPSSDVETATAGISYNVRIGTIQNQNSELSGMSLSNGTRLVEKQGNINLRTSKELTLPNGEYFWQVQAQDAAYYESEFSEPYSFCITDVPEITLKEHYCFGELIQLEATGNNIVWYEDASMQSPLYLGRSYELIGEKSRVLYVTQETDGCISEAIEVKLTIGDPGKIELLVDGSKTETADITFKQCTPDDVFVIEATSNFPTVTWQSTVDNSTTIAIENPGTYTVTASDEYGCSNARSVNVSIETLNEVFIPNVITPNNDGKNDFFMPSGFEHFDLNLSLFNRYGVRIFQSSNYTYTFNGSDLSSGTYFYELSVNGCRQSWKGWLSILK